MSKIKPQHESKATIGPALGGLLLTATSVQVVLFAFAGASLVSVSLIWRIRGEAPREVEPDLRALPTLA